MLRQFALPVFVDTDPETFQMDHRLVERAITPRTKAVLPVHLYGHPCDLDPLLAICRKHNLPLIEDAAQALGAEIRTEAPVARIVVKDGRATGVALYFAHPSGRSRSPPHTPIMMNIGMSMASQNT